MTFVVLATNCDFLLRPAKEVWGKVMFLHLSVCPQGEGGAVMSLPVIDSTPTPWTAPPPVTVEELAVRILVECFLVVHNVVHKYRRPFSLHEQSWYRTPLLKCTVFILQIALLGTIAMFQGLEHCGCLDENGLSRGLCTKIYASNNVRFPGSVRLDDERILEAAIRPS